jgi:hypothetical protein
MGLEMPNVERKREDAIKYLAEMSETLATLARKHGLDTLAYLYDMAAEEAHQQQRIDTDETGTDRNTA